MSVLLLDPQKKLPHEALTIAAGLAVADALAEVTCLEPELKWPNDVLISGRKISGIIVERRTSPDGQTFVVGVGVNVSSRPPDEAVDCPATSLSERLGDLPDRAEIVRAILRQLDVQISAIQAGQLEALHEGWLGRCGMMHERIAVESLGKRYIGRVLDVDPLRGLVLADDHGWRVYIPAPGATIASPK
jgi:BirA family biotin operon repressor/biotin-[acetyl-CoA-carboxylase] ligase